MAADNTMIRLPINTRNRLKIYSINADASYAEAIEDLLDRAEQKQTAIPVKFKLFTYCDTDKEYQRDNLIGLSDTDYRVYNTLLNYPNKHKVTINSLSENSKRSIKEVNTSIKGLIEAGLIYINTQKDELLIGNSDIPAIQLLTKATIGE